MNLRLLAEPFPASDIEWRIGQSGQNSKGIWAKVLAYITNRAIMERLDEVCGPENWRNEFRYEGQGVLCGISIWTPDKGWVAKWDGAENTDVEAVKGGLSSAMKRAGVQWGIGRYLYQLEEGWAVIGPEGSNYVAKNDKKEMPAFRWDPPKLPKWALPASDEKDQPSRPITPPAKREPEPHQGDVKAVAGAVAAHQAAVDRIVKGKALGDYTGPELNAMQKALRTEGKDKHKFLLADITTVLNDRLLGPSKKNAPPLSDEQRGELVKKADVATATDPSLPFA